MENSSTTCLPESSAQAVHSRLWYAVYTASNQEKKVAEYITSLGVESFLPLYQTTRRRTDRQVRLSLPLFPGYLFVHTTPFENQAVLRAPKVVRLVGFNGSLLPLPVNQVESLRRSLENLEKAEPHPYLRIGKRVRIINGAFSGWEGLLLRKTLVRVVISLELIQRSFSIEVCSSDIEPV